MADEDAIGQVVRRVRFPVEAGKIHEFATSIMAEDPVFHDAEAARAAGHDTVPAPLTFSVVMAHHPVADVPERTVAEIVGLDRRRSLHAEQSWTYHRPMVAGDVLEGDVRIAAIERKTGRRGGEMVFVTTEAVLRDTTGTPVVTVASTIVQTEEVVSSD